MRPTLTIELPDELYQHLFKWAQMEGRTPDALATEYLTNIIQRLANDPLLQLAGSVTSDVTDVCERHDEYIGQALFEEMRGQPDE